MDSSKKRLLIFSVGVVVVIVALALFFTYFNKNANNNKVQNQVATSSPEDLMKQAQTNSAAVNYSFDAQAEKNRELGVEDLKKMAASFAERFGSYSNQANYGNVVDLKIFMTESLKTWADNYIKELKAKDQDLTKYYGITTSAISSEVKNFDSKSGQADIVVATQRREVREVVESPAFKQNLAVKFVKENGEWKVDSVSWQK